MGIYAIIVAYSGLLCSVCRKNAYFAKIFARLRKLYYISPRKDETTTTKNENTMKNTTRIKYNGKCLTKFDVACMIDRFDVHAHATILIDVYSYAELVQKLFNVCDCETCGAIDWRNHLDD